MKRTLVLAAALTAVAMLTTACGGSAPSTSTPAAPSPSAAAPSLSGTIKIDGSSTVFPITEAVAEEFMKSHKDVQVTVGISGSSGGFKKWVKGETDINNSSRAIKQSEIDAAKEAGFGHAEIAVAYDGLSVIVSKENTWLTCITKEQLKQIWEPESKVARWSDVDPSWPNEEIKLYGPGTDSGTFEYFTEFAMEKTGASRSDYTASEDDNQLVLGVAGNRNSMGYFGFAYYEENRDTLRALPVDSGSGCIEPNNTTIGDLSYPIARLIYIYPNTTSMERPEVKAFLSFYVKNAPSLVKQVGYTPLPQKMYDDALEAIK